MCTDEWMDGWMNECLDGLMDRRHPLFVNAITYPDKNNSREIRAEIRPKSTWSPSEIRPKTR